MALYVEQWIGPKYRFDLKLTEGEKEILLRRYVEECDVKTMTVKETEGLDVLAEASASL